MQTSFGWLVASRTMMTKLRDGVKDAFATNKRDLDDGVEDVRSALGVRRDSGAARTARETAGEKKGLIGLPLKVLSLIPPSILPKSLLQRVPLRPRRLQVRVKESLDLRGCLSLIFHL